MLMKHIPYEEGLHISGTRMIDRQQQLRGTNPCDTSMEHSTERDGDIWLGDMSPLPLGIYLDESLKQVH